MLQLSYFLQDDGVLAVKLQTPSGRSLGCVWPTEKCTATEVTYSITPIAHVSQNPSSDCSPFRILMIRAQERGCTGHLCPGPLLPDFHAPRAQGPSKLPTASRPWYVLATDQTSPPRISNSFPQIHFCFSATKTLCGKVFCCAILQVWLPQPLYRPPPAPLPRKWVIAPLHLLCTTLDFCKPSSTAFSQLWKALLYLISPSEKVIPCFILVTF